VISVSNEPVPEPAEAMLPLTSGPWEVLQQTPRAVTSTPPPEVTSPLALTEVSVMSESEAVITVGRTESFLQPKNVTAQAVKKDIASNLTTFFIFFDFMVWNIIGYFRK